MTITRNAILIGTAAAVITVAAPARAAVPTGPIPIGDGVTFDPMLDARVRYEHVDQPTLDADAVTIRMRPGVEIAVEGGFSLLFEGEATLAVHDNYNDTLPVNGVEPYSVVADPQNIEINRAQLMYKSSRATFTIGRQRINLDDQRWVGSVGWRQNEQTFDAARLQFTGLGPLVLDATYSRSQRTIFGFDAGNRQSMQGDFAFLSAGVKLAKTLEVKAFAYLLDYNQNEPLNAAMRDSQTFGVLAIGSLPIAQDFALTLKASYAVQKDYKDTAPADYSVDYITGEIGATVAGFGVTAGYEQLGADSAGNRVQTPFATLHKFNGWADIFLVTPATGLKDYYLTLGRKLPGVKLLPGLNASVTYHRFDADRGGQHYGDEWNAQLGFKLKGTSILTKYARYNQKGAVNFATDTDTEKVWFEIGYAF